MSFRRGALCAAFLLLCFRLGAQEVALTFDDLPYTGAQIPGSKPVETIQTLVKILKDAHAPRVYGFLNAGKGELEAVKPWLDAGFPVANHGYSHMNLAKTKVKKYVADITRNEEALRTLMPNQESAWHWYRFPYLEEGDSMKKRRAVAGFLKQNGYRVAEVTLDFQDFWWNAPYARCLQREDKGGVELLKQSYLDAADEFIDLGQAYSKALYGRDIKHIMLLHVGGFETVMLPELLKLLEQKRFKLTTLEDAAADPAYQDDPAVLTKHGGDFLKLMMSHRHLKIPKHKKVPTKQLDRVCRGR